MYIMNNLENSKIGEKSVSIPAVPVIVDVIPDPIPASEHKIDTLVENVEIVENVKIVSNSVENPNVLNVYKTVVTHLISFEILIIRVIPFTMASIDIQILTDKGHIYRTVNLIGPDYLKWSTSDLYLYVFVRENLDKIY